MIKINQKVFPDTSKPLSCKNYGDCYAACIASILELPLENIPLDYLKDSNDNNKFYEIINTFLLKFGLYIIPDINFGNKESLKHYINGYAIGFGTSPRQTEACEMLHAVVIYNGEVVHDPHPKHKENDIEITKADLIMNIDPLVNMIHYFSLKRN